MLAKIAAIQWGCEWLAFFASELAPTGVVVQLGDLWWLVWCFREQARSHRGWRIPYGHFSPRFKMLLTWARLPQFVARGFIGMPHHSVRLRSSRGPCARGVVEELRSRVSGPLRAPTGINPLATGGLPT